MGLHLKREPVPPDPDGDYEVAAESFTYTYAKGRRISGSTVDLVCTAFVGDGWDPSVPRAVAVRFDTGGFVLSSGEDNEINRAIAEFYVRCGIIYVACESRIHPDAPWEPGAAARGASTALATSIDAILHDGPLAFKFIASNPDRDNWIAEPRWIFYGGNSSAGMIATMSTIRWAPSQFDPAGLIVGITAFGFDNGLFGMDATDEIRTELGHTEAQYTNGMAPVLALIIAQDDVLKLNPGAPEVVDLWRARVEAKAIADDLSVAEVDENDPTRYPFGGSPPNHWQENEWREDTLVTGDTLSQVIGAFGAACVAERAPLTGTLHLAA